MNAEAARRLFTEFPLVRPEWSVFTAFNLVVLLGSVALLVVALRRSKHVLMRTAFQSGILVLALFQVPLFLFSNILASELTRSWMLSFALHSYVVGSFIWVLSTPKLTKNYSALLRFDSRGADSASRGRSIWRRSLPMFFVTGLFFTFVGLYLQHVGFECTGLFALLADPALTLMAREVSVKFVNASYATFALSLVVNVVGPILIVVLGEMFSHGLKRFNWLVMSTVAVSIFLVLAAILLSGAKGNLLPTLIVSAVTVFLTFKKPIARILAVFAVVAGAVILMVGLEVLKDRGVATPSRVYPYGACVAKLNSCERGKVLVDSLSSRVLTMGVWSHRVAPLQADWRRNCGGAKESVASSETKSPEETVSSPSSTEAVEGAPTTLETALRAGSRLDRAILYASSIGRRIFVVPLQIAAWHFQYADEVFSPGASYLPFAKGLSGARVTDMPSRVHREYAPIYSAGSTDSTGTAPTAFLISAVAYMGPWGILFSLLFIVGLDVVSALVAARVSAHLGFALVGLAAVGNVNLMLTDFDSAMMSHGTAFAILLLLGLSVADRFFDFVGRKRRDRGLS